jgi:hypothetical protein
MSGAIPPLPQYASMAWCLVKARDNFYTAQKKVTNDTVEEANLQRSCKIDLLVLFVPTGTQGLNNFTIVEVSIAVKFFYRDRVAIPVLQPPTWRTTHFCRLLRHAWATVGLFHTHE